MESMKLFVVYLGGKLVEGRMGEDHEVVVVVAEDVTSARRAAKSRWRGVGDPHIDAVRQLDVVDGYKVMLSEAEPFTDGSPVDSTWVP